MRINVQRVGQETPISVFRVVHKHVKVLRDSMPEALKLHILNDMSDIFQQRMELLLENAYLGLGLVFILLALFLETRLAFWVSLGIPISFLDSFLLLSGVDISINMVSMFAFIVILGIVVDDAIVAERTSTTTGSREWILSEPRSRVPKTLHSPLPSIS